MMLLVLAGFLVVGAAAASILARDSVPFAGFTFEPDHDTASSGPVANREGKKDRLRSASLPLRPSHDGIASPPSLPEPLRQAFASDSPMMRTSPDIAAPVAIPPSARPQPPKLVAKPAPQKSYALLSDMQIAAIKGRLKLTPDQESAWPGVENALRAIARKIHLDRQSNPVAGGPPIDPDSAEVTQLKSAAMPLLFKLREDQKREVRALARIIGLEAVASRI